VPTAHAIPTSKHKTRVLAERSQYFRDLAALNSFPVAAPCRKEMAANKSQKVKSNQFCIANDSTRSMSVIAIFRQLTLHSSTCSLIPFDRIAPRSLDQNGSFGIFITSRA
jgi:hypothetical protein